MSEIVEDWYDLYQQMRKRTGFVDEDVLQVAGAIVLLARELRHYRRWAEEHHST